MTTENDRRRKERSRPAQLPVRLCGPQDSRVLSVFCPRRQRALDIAKCIGCEHGTGLSFDTEQRALSMGCEWRVDGLRLPSASDAHDSTLASLVSRPVDCVKEDAALDSVLARFLRENIDAAPVVDDKGQTVGILSKSDLLRWYGEPTQPGATSRVREAMSHLVYTLHAEADIVRAAALMAYENVHQIVVTAQDGCPIGLVSSLDILRCIARRNGYAMSESE